MFVDLSWANLNAVGTTLNLYRGDKPLDRAALPATPLVSLTNGETSYRDTKDVLVGKTYYYIFETITPTDRIVSKNYEATAISRRGPGTQVLKQGNNTLGYFGTLQSGEFITGADLFNKTGVQGQASSVLLQSSPLWHKFVRNNKILLLPEGPIANAVTWLQLYNLGLVYGVDKAAPDGAAAPGTIPQSFKIKIGPDTFRVRLMKGLTDKPYTGYFNGAVDSINEWGDLVAPMIHTVIPEQRLDNLNVNGQMLYKVIGLNGATTYTMVQELYQSGYMNTRGQSVSTRDDTSDLTTYLANRSNGQTTSAAVGFAWWPVLELVEGV